MSKRHRKTKDMMSSLSMSGDVYAMAVNYDTTLFETPRGKKPKGRLKRVSHKRAYYDD